jgi:hypothetical protein
VRAGAEGGEFTTPLLRLRENASGSTALRINYATSALGSIRVEVLSPDGKTIVGFAAADCAQIYGDELARAVTWRKGSALPSGAFRLRFKLRDADLYAIALQ